MNLFKAKTPVEKQKKLISEMQESMNEIKARLEKMVEEKDNDKYKPLDFKAIEKLFAELKRIKEEFGHSSQDANTEYEAERKKLFGENKACFTEVNRKLIVCLQDPSSSKKLTASQLANLFVQYSNNMNFRSLSVAFTAMIMKCDGRLPLEISLDYLNKNMQNNENMHDLIKSLLPHFPNLLVNHFNALPSPPLGLIDEQLYKLCFETSDTEIGSDFSSKRKELLNIYKERLKPLVEQKLHQQLKEIDKLNIDIQEKEKALQSESSQKYFEDKKVLDKKYFEIKDAIEPLHKEYIAAKKNYEGQKNELIYMLNDKVNAEAKMILLQHYLAKNMKDELSNRIRAITAEKHSDGTTNSYKKELGDISLLSDVKFKPEHLIELFKELQNLPNDKIKNALIQVEKIEAHEREYNQANEKFTLQEKELQKIEKESQSSHPVKKLKDEHDILVKKREALLERNALFLGQFPDLKPAELKRDQQTVSVPTRTFSSRHPEIFQSDSTPTPTSQVTHASAINKRRPTAMVFTSSPVPTPTWQNAGHASSPEQNPQPRLRAATIIGSTKTQPTNIPLNTDTPSSVSPDVVTSSPSRRPS